MYTIETSTKKIEKRLELFMKKISSIRQKLKRLRLYPRNAINAHPLQGEFKGLWSCYLSRNPDIVMIYFIDDKNKKIGILRVGSHTQTY